MPIRYARLISLLLVLAAPTGVLANPFEQQLANGLRIIVKEDHRAPTAAHMVWYHAGSMDETNGTTGVAHLLEHMMFKGTPSTGPGEFSRRVAAAGGRDNAFTNKDYTAYFQQVPKQKLALMMQLEADRMRHLNLDSKEFAQEIKVVMEERRLRTDDQPQSLLYEQALAVALQAHPYRVPVIGWMNDLESMNVGDARTWYTRWYVPNNALVVIVGDVDHQEVFKLAEKYYGALAPRALPARKPQLEPQQTGIRRLTVKAPAELPVVLMAYKVPVLRDVEKDVDPYALEMLAAILDGHEAARFSKSLIREQRLATSAGAGYDSTARGPGLFFLQASPSEGRTRAELEAGLRAEITRIVKEGVTTEELARAKAQLVASEIYKLDSMFAQAMEIGQLESVGISYRLNTRMIEKLQDVNADQVRTIAQKYFGDDQLTVAELDPQPLPQTPRAHTAQPRH
ncbi:pitrilysin family protein [Propionivibrio sp.]|uniref:M16 family metallopeptidase n=1 Tax=Propionivibrio sp. TaxID=2212460 RepID=UPI0025E4FCF7|nr:pitrilysin family protein [Propionivibrio sp.]MBK7355346.1 insulinase family protein [Propionivibrio sp.]MBK8399742.1 insulinase family protein [Propionivibrio sp.]MBK8743362.1 insulinase family protein [Propionivibrio sp.]MBK8894614.1 insulinase family protein [Propionivibrio sp.]MBL0207097.1 insulinase family protein [Propionivibrio sp.]